MNSLYIYFFLHVTSENFDQNSHANFLLLYLEPVSDYYDSDRLFWRLKSCVYTCINSMVILVLSIYKLVLTLNVISNHRWYVFFFLSVMQFAINTEYTELIQNTRVS